MALNTASALGGAGTGAIYGGQFAGPVGAAAGGVLGGLLGLFGGSKKKPKKISTMDPTQQGIYADYAKALRGEGGPLADIFAQFDPEQLSQMFQQKYAEPQYENYRENIVPGITGAFRKGNIQNSSYLAGHLAKEGTKVQRGLDAQLAEMLYNAQQSSVDRRDRGVQNILNTKTFDYQKNNKSLIDELLAAMAGGAGNLFANQMNDRYNKPSQSTYNARPGANVGAY